MSEGRTRQAVTFGEVLALIVLVLVGVLNVGLADLVDLTKREQAFANFLTLVASIYVAYVFGQRVGRRGTIGQMKSAYRRALGLFAALGRDLDSIEERRGLLANASLAGTPRGSVSMERVGMALDHLAAQISEQIIPAQQALGDWKDMAPDAVGAVHAELEEASRERSRPH
jgi:hypothetical protein